MVVYLGGQKPQYSPLTADGKISIWHTGAAKEAGRAQTAWCTNRRARAQGIAGKGTRNQTAARQTQETDTRGLSATSTTHCLCNTFIWMQCTNYYLHNDYYQ